MTTNPAGAILGGVFSCYRSAMLRVCTFKWRPAPGYRSEFRSEHVNVLARMVARHYPSPHEFVCITDDARGLDKAIRVVPLWNDYADLPNPNGRHNPSCYRRLKLFSAEAADIIGPRFVCIDIDAVIVADVRPLWDRPEPFIIWGDTHPRTFYNGSMWLMTAGARRKVWDTFDPQRSPRQSKLSGNFGSDQGWISTCLGHGEATWGARDGVYSYRVHIHPNGDALPANARVVLFHGKHDPWHPQCQRVGWIREHWR